MIKLFSIVAIVLLSTTATIAQIKNSKTETLKVYGSCGMCKTKIEKAGAQKNISKVVWNQETNMATITYDSKKTNTDAVLKKIALVGYDSDNFLAPNNVYAKLPGCCKYDRKTKPETAVVTPKDETKEDHTGHNHNEAVKPTEAIKPAEDHTGHNHDAPKTQVQPTETNQIQTIYDNYFALKDALVNTDAITAAATATTFLAAINNLNISAMKMNDHMAFMKVEKALKENATIISTSKSISAQRNAFSNLSNSIIPFLKVTKATTPIYWQHCPMANYGKGADWLSKENTIKNPFYGNMMLNCGKVIETIK